MIAADLKRVTSRPSLSRYLVLALMDDTLSISSWHADRIYEALTASGRQRARDVLLILWSNGGSVKPAYQISKLCKKFAKSCFVVAVPRHAKSAFGN